MKAVRFLVRIIRLILGGQVSLALYSLAGELPRWLFRYNRAEMLSIEPASSNVRTDSEITVRLADQSDLDAIVRINSQSPEYVRALMDSGARCYIGSIGNSPPASVFWSLTGRFYIRGMGFVHDFGSNSRYLFGAYSLPEARGKGLYSQVQLNLQELEREAGASKFWVLVEFTNDISARIHRKLGYEPSLSIIHIKLLFLWITCVKKLPAGRWTFRMFVRQPDKNVPVV